MFHLFKHSAILFPIIDDMMPKDDCEITSLFLQGYRAIQFQRDETRVLSAIGKAGDMSGHSCGVVAKTLVDQGLRAGRESFPKEFLDYMDTATLRGSLNHAQNDLYNFWVEQGLSPFYVATHAAPQTQIPSFVTA